MKGTPRIAYILRILIKASFDEFFELSRVVPGQLRGVVLGDQEQDPHGVHLGVGGFALGQFDRSNSWNRENLT